MTSAGDLAALLGGAHVQTASARIHDWLDPHATLAAWSVGPWAAEAAGGDPGVFGLPAEPFTDESRQWLDLEHGRAREERAGLIVVKDGPRWWRTGGESGEEPASTIDAAETLRVWTRPQALTRFLDLEAAGETPAGLLVSATARADAAYAPDLAPLGWGASRWELIVDRERGVLLGTTAFHGDTAFRRVEASELAFDEPLDPALFAPL
jgi:hypothetical protein